MVKISGKGRSWGCLPGGSIEPDETPEEAIVRELREELNLQVEPSQRLYETSMPREPGTDYGMVIDPPADVPHLGIALAVFNWAWRSLDEVEDSWQVAEARRALKDEA